MVVILIFVICGFLYGSDYFRFNEAYGNSSATLGIYILSLKWWNTKLNWYTYLDRWFLEFSIKFRIRLTRKAYTEYIVVFNDTGVKFCVLNIN